MERHDKVEKKGPSIPTYVFLPFLVFAKVDEAPQCVEIGW